MKKILITGCPWSVMQIVYNDKIQHCAESFFLICFKTSNRSQMYQNKNNGNIFMLRYAFKKRFEKKSYNQNEIKLQLQKGYWIQKVALKYCHNYSKKKRDCSYNRAKPWLFRLPFKANSINKKKASKTIKKSKKGNMSLLGSRLWFYGQAVATKIWYLQNLRTAARCPRLVGPKEN